jgi:hypothetical protein
MAHASGIAVRTPTPDDESLRHQLLLQLQGIHLAGADAAGESFRMYRELRVRFLDDGEGFEAATMKIPARSAFSTPYTFVDGELLVSGKPLASLIGRRCVLVPIPPAEDEWHLKGYTFPFRGSRNPHYELRLNPRITGYCPGKCSFCHRTHSHQVKPDRRVVTAPSEIVDRIASDEGPVFGRIERVMFIAELFGREDRFLDTLAEARDALLARGYAEDREFNCCAQDVRTLPHHRRLLSIVRPSRYSYTLEFFTRRHEIMGGYKGIPMEGVYRILESARSAGFEEIQLNYLAGIDSLRDCIDGFSDLRARGLVDSVGFSTFTAWSADQQQLRHEEARDWRYYRDMARELGALGIKAYRPHSYDMRCPYHVLMQETIL